MMTLAHEEMIAAGAPVQRLLTESFVWAYTWVFTLI